MKILVLNCGSSSLKYQLMDMADESVVAKGNYERIGQNNSFLTHKVNGEKYVIEEAVPTHDEAIKIVIDQLLNEKYGVIKSLDEIDGIGHRIVHGGEKFSKSVIVTDEVEKAINSWELIEKTLKEKKFMKLRRDIKKNLLKLFENENISITLKKIFTEEQINFFLQLTFNLSQFREIQVNEDKSNSNLIARAKESVNVYFDYKSENSSSIIIQSYSLGENSKSNLSGNESKSNTNNIFNKKKEYNNWIASKSDKFKKSNKYQILEHYEVIGKHKSAEFSRELSNGEFLSGGNDKYLYWYDITFALKKKIFVEYNQHNLYEIKSR